MSSKAMKMAAMALLGMLTMRTVPAAAQTAAPAKPAKAPRPDNYEDMFARYLEQARSAAAAVTGAGAWSWMNGLALDARARHVNDLVTINVVENITAAGSADAALAKDSTGAVGVTSFFGVEHALPASINPDSLVGLKSKTDFKGSGTTTRAGQLSALFTARVTEVLPNGDLVIQGIHEVTINGDNQIVVLTGVARVADVSPGNVVQSTSIAQLSIRYFGRGLIKDNLNPGWLIRVLNKVF